MGLKKQYLRYGFAESVGCICTSRRGVAFCDRGGVKNKYIVTPAGEDVSIWNLKTTEKIVYSRGECEASCLTVFGEFVVVGYVNGTVRILRHRNAEEVIVFKGHKSEISALAFDHSGLLLASCSLDGDIVIWDIVSESGLYRLKGHKSGITQCRFLKSQHILVTSSKDSFIKFWSLDTQHCFKTILGHRTPIWDFCLVNDDSLLITGSLDNELRLFTLEDITSGVNAISSKIDSTTITDDKLQPVDEEKKCDNDYLRVTCFGSLTRRTKGRAVQMQTDPSGRILVCLGVDKNIELFRISSDEQVRAAVAKRVKRHKRKRKDSDGMKYESTANIDLHARAEDYVTPIFYGSLPAKPASIDCFITENQCEVVVALKNNSICLYTFDLSESPVKLSTPTKQICTQGHRSDVRTVAFSSDDSAIVTASADTLKLWNRSSLQCIRTIECKYALSCCFAPGDRHVVIATKTGELQLFDLSSSELLEEIHAHEGEVWSINLYPDKRGFVSGGADKLVKFWNFELKNSPGEVQAALLSIENNRILQMAEDVLCVRISNDSKFVAASLMDMTVKILYFDTLKFFLSLYGHKLPVLCLDISSDSQLIVTCSADRNVRIWGIDFGDCHKSIFAHDDSILAVCFQPKTHLFFTAGKDKKVKYFDADKFEHIQTLEGHHAEVWALAVSNNGKHVASVSHDKSIRLWERTQEPLIPEDEQEQAREKEFEEGVVDQEPVLAGEDPSTSEVAFAGKKTVETVASTERLIEAIELHRVELTKPETERNESMDPASVNPLLLAYGVKTTEDYCLEVLRRIKSSELEETLLVLPFAFVPDLLRLLGSFIKRNVQIELTTRCLLFLLRVHHGQIVANESSLLSTINSLRLTTTSRLSDLKDCIGFNSAALQFLKQRLEDREEEKLFRDATVKRKERKSKHRAILTIRT